MIRSFITKTRWLVTIILLTTLAVPHTWATSARISAYGSITSGRTYWMGASTGSPATDYYWQANGGIATSNSNLTGVAVTSASSGTVVKFTGSSTSWTIQFLNGNYLTIPSTDANGKYKSQTASATWTLSNASSLIKMTINSHVFQKNNSTTAFGSYKTTSNQKNIWLEPALKVKYVGNGNTSGTAPDSAFYLTNTTVTVASNTGSLAKTGYTFGGWNTRADGNGTNYTAGSGTFSITGDIILYAKWVSAGTSVSLSKAATSNGSFSLSSDGPLNTTSAAQTITVTGSPSSGYYLSGVTQSGASAAPTITKTSATTYTIQYAQSCTGTSTITATFSPIWQLRGSFNTWGAGNPCTTIADGVAATTIDLAKNTKYEFQFYDASQATDAAAYHGNGGNIVEDMSGWTFGTGNPSSNCKIFTGKAGTYTFKINMSTKVAQVIYPTVSDHPNDAYNYFKKWADWNNNYFVYWWGESELQEYNSAIQVTKTATICETDYVYFPILTDYTNFIAKDAASGDGSHKTGNVTSTNTHGGDYHDCTSWREFETYTISYDKGTGSGSTMASETDICPGGEQALSANTYNKDHYHFTGWKTNVAVTINTGGGDQNIDANGIVPGGATIKSIGSNVTLTAQWEINSNTLTWNWGGGSTTSTTYTLYPATSGSVNYGATITKPANGTMSKTGYNFSSWSSNATTMPDEALTITANWSAKTYSNTLDREGGTTGSTTVTTTYNSNTLTGYTAPTKTGYTFGGYWSGDDGTGTEVIGTNGALKASVTVSAVAWTNSSSQWVKDGAVTMYAKWTAKNYTVTLNDGSGSGGDGTVSVTYNSNTNISDVTKPTYAGNDFRGYYTSTGGSGTKVIDGNGAWIRGTSYVDASGNWVYDGSPTLHAYYTAYEYENYRTMCSPVTCGAPDLSSPTPTAYGATISWTDAGKAGTLDHYEYAVWADGAVEPTSGFTSTGTTKSATVSGLLSNTLYNYKVRRVCSGDDESFWSDGTFTTSYVALTFSVPTGASAVAGQNSNVALPDAEVPTDCGDCWDFVGWTTAAYAESSSVPSKLFYEGDIVHLSSSDGTTLHAVYQKSKYQRISSTGDLTAGEDYVLMNIMQGNEYALANSAQADFPTTDAAWADIRMLMETDGDDSYVKNPGASIIWRFSGTYSAGQLYNATADKYLNLSGSGSILSTTNDLTFGISASNSLGWDVHSTNYLRQYYITNSDPLRGGWDAYASLSSGNFSAYIYKRIETKYATSPSCEVYTVTWNVNNGATTSTTDVLSCSGHLGSLPSAPADNTLSSCIATGGKFMGWSASKVLPATDTRPDDLFDNLVDAPDITESTTFYAVFAKETTGATGATSKEYTFTSGSWADSEGAWTSGKDGGWYNSAVQVSTAKSGANATTKSSYDDVTQVDVAYFTNGSAGAGTITIEVDGTAYTGSASVTSSGGTTPRTINFTPPSSALDGAVKITVTCSTNSVYIKSVKIYYTGTTTTYTGYRSACCNDAQLKFLDGEGDPTTEYVIVREDLASASAGVTIGCGISSLNTTGAITWASTHRDKNDYASAYTWSSSQPANLNIDIANEEITAKETGVWQITISQAAGATTFCPEDATVTVRVKTIDKFIDAVNGNFSGEPQSLEDTGNGILLPTEAMFSTNNGCSTTRRLIGWIKASDLATYASGRRVDMIDDLKTGDASNKVIAPGTKVQATGVTWYAVWGVEK